MSTAVLSWRDRLRALDVRAPAYWLVLLSIGVLYFATGKFGIGLSVADGVITPVWAPTGIALAAVLVVGFRVWPAIALAAFLVNLTSGADPGVAAAIGAGNTLEVLIGGYLLARVGFSPALGRVRDVLALVILGAGAGTLVAATVGVGALTLAGAGGESFGARWLLWWFGDAVGALMVAPLLLIVFSTRRRTVPLTRLLEGAALVLVLTVLAGAIFLAGAWGYPYLVFPALLWAAIRFRQLGAAAASLLLGAIGTWGALVGTVEIGVTTATQRVQIIQALVAVVAISLLVVGATLAERERLLAVERSQNDRLRELDRLKDAFLTTVSHELRTPLTSIVGYLELVAEPDLAGPESQQRRFAEVALRNSARLDRLIGDLLFVAQADAGKLVIEHAPVDLSDIARKSVESLQLWAQEAGVELVFTGRPAPLSGDPVSLAQLVENLVTNAIKFSPRGARIEVRTGRVGPDRVLIEVEDEGCGIPLEEQPHIFTRFFRTKQASEDAVQGTGLGLSIAKTIAHAHQGTLTFASVPGHGTTFSCELPTEGAATAERDQRPAPRAPAEAAST